MELLDTRTLLLTITALLVARAVVLAHVWGTMRDYAPLGHWTAGSVLVAFGALLAGLREIAPPGVSIVLAQSCIVPGWLLIDAGIVMAAGRQPPWRPAIALLAILFPALVWYTQVEPDYVARTVVTTVPALLFDLYALYACLGVRDGRCVTTLRILAAMIVMLAASNAWKMLGAMMLQATNLLQPNPPLTQFLLVSMTYFIVTTGIFVLLAAQQLQEVLDRELAVRRRAESELERHRDQLEDLVRERTAELEERSAQLAQTEFAMERVGIGVTWTDAETGRFIHVNDDACRQLGYSREELLTMGISDINPSIPPGAPDADTRALASEGRFRIETTHRRKDGSTCPVEVTSYLYRHEDREWFIAFFEDITERKAAEADLVTAKEMAEAASRAKSAFLATMSHELRTPMNAIMGMSFIARHHSKDREVLHSLEQIDAAASRLLHVINQVLDIADIESARLELKPVEFCLPEVLQITERLVADEVRAKGLEFVVRLPEQLATTTVFGDKLRLGQIVNDLVGNAVKYTERGSVSVTITAVPATGDVLMLEVEVADTGIGIAEADQGRLFSTFGQLDTSLTRQHGGCGLGLAISKHLAQLMGGDIVVHSAPGKGSRFLLTVRLERR